MTTQTQASPLSVPRVSVVVPTCRRVQLLERCLEALLAQALPAAQFEILVVDDGPSQRTRQVAGQWRARAAARGLVLRYLVNTGTRGAAGARNMGWRLARAPVIAFTADDGVPSPGWLRQGLLPFIGGADVVCGRVETPLPERPTDYQRSAQRRQGAACVMANMFVRRPVLEALGGFDESFRYAWREDSDLYFRLLDGRAHIVRARQAMVIHPVRHVPWGVSLLQLRPAAFDALLYKKHPARYRQQIRAMPHWDHYAIVAALAVGGGALAAGAPWLAAAAGAAWLALTALLCAGRLRGTSRRLPHVAEVAITSLLIPPLAVFWRLAGAIRFRVAFT